MIHRCPGHPASVVPAPRAPHPGCRPGRRRRRHGRVRGDHGGPAPGAARWALPRWALGVGRSRAWAGGGRGAVRCGRCGGGERRVEGRAERWGEARFGRSGVRSGVRPPAVRATGARCQVPGRPGFQATCARCQASGRPCAVCQATGVSACGLQCAGRQASASRHQGVGRQRVRVPVRPGTVCQAPGDRASGLPGAVGQNVGARLVAAPGVRRPRGQGVKGSRHRGVEVLRC